MSPSTPGPFADATSLRDAIARGEISAEAACDAALARIGADDGALHAFQHVSADRARTRARALDRAGVSAGPLHGVPIAIKDNLAVRGLPATAGSRLLEHYVPPFDATVTEQIERAGGVIVGKTVCDEFAMGSSTENSAFGPARNPWARDRVPGGSSGGSAVAVAAGFVPLALGSDTGGSIRQPASMCGVVGLKPTYGRVSRYGLIAFASSLDQVGPITRSVRDAALALEVISGSDPRDATSVAKPAGFLNALSGDIRNLRIGVPDALLTSGVDPHVLAAFHASLDVLQQAGAVRSSVALPHSGAGIPVYYLVATAEASSNLARYDGVRFGTRAAGTAGIDEMYEKTRRAGFGAEVKRRIMLGTYALSAGYYDAYYLQAQKVRTLIRRDFERAFEHVDVVALPTTPTGAFRLGERTADPWQMYLADVFTVGAPLAGLPALSVPCGFTPERLPVGLQLVGRAWDEATVLKVADVYARATPWSGMHPDGLTSETGVRR